MQNRRAASLCSLERVVRRPGVAEACEMNDKQTKQPGGAGQARPEWMVNRAPSRPESRELVEGAVAGETALIDGEIEERSTSMTDTKLRQRVWTLLWLE